LDAQTLTYGQILTNVGRISVWISSNPPRAGRVRATAKRVDDRETEAKAKGEKATTKPKDASWTKGPRKHGD